MAADTSKLGVALIRVIAFEDKRKGDLFTERMADLVHAIGFDVESMNLNRSGRELDILASHRIEKRKALVECKAQADPVGGSDISKFIGVLDAERRRSPDIPMTGFFVSMSGFTGTAIEQENEFDNSRCSLLGPKQVRTELVASRIVVSAPRAVAAVAAITADSRPIDVDPDLVATEYGWVWQVLIADRGEQSACCFVHADGHTLPRHQSEKLAGVIPEIAGLRLVHDDREEAAPHELESRYLEHLVRQAGTVTHEGLPADSQVSVGVELEKLYVPLRVEEWKDDGDITGLNSPGPENQPKKVSIGAALEGKRHISIVGAPGSGKSTLLNRIALAYVNHDVKFLNEAGLSTESLFPVLVRCRDASVGGASFLDLVRTLVEQFGQAGGGERFESVVMGALRQGRALILVDGLDEISSVGARVSFVRNLRSLIATYPANRLVLTSREPGFRPVAGALANHGARYRVSEMDDRSVRLLVERWGELIPRRNPARSGVDIAAQILGNSRMRLLATTPLLLTTLLLVERWVGDLPRRRTVLYDKAIEVLLMTWNVEGHEPLNLDEVLPQLAYVAYDMTSGGMQRLSASALVELLSKARRDMPDVLGYVQNSPSELLERIEMRSSLLSQAGFVVEGGRLQPFFEFRHLTFQEYLTALACVKGWNASGLTVANPEESLVPHYGDQTWFEVIPIAAVLAGRAGTAIVESILTYVDETMEAASESDEDDSDEQWQKAQDCLTVLVSCLVDDVVCRPDVARRAISTSIELGSIDGFMEEYFVAAMLSGKFGEELRRVVREGVGVDDFYAIDHASMAGQILEHDMMIGALPRGDLARELVAFLVAEDRYQLLATSGLLLHYAYLQSQGELVQYSDVIVDEINQALELCRDPMIHVYTSANGADATILATTGWALSWMLHDVEVTDEVKQAILDKALQLVFRSDSDRAASFSCWLINQNCLARRGALQMSLTEEQCVRISEVLTAGSGPSEGVLDHESRAAFTLAYMSGLLDDEELQELVAKRLDLLNAKAHPDRKFLEHFRRLASG